MPIPTGTLIGPYEIVGWLGAGGMGEVYRARDPRLGREVAIKLIPVSYAADRSRLHRFEQEARAAGQLNHPNILAVYDVGTHEGAPYIVSELLEGESLGSRLHGGALASRKAIDYARQTAEGLAAAHDKGIVHRDLKPDNLFVTNDGRIKILDFGIAKLTGPSGDTARRTGFPTETAEGMVVGTAGYMSPEQVRGEDVDARSDLFSFGAILYEMLAGRAAFIRPTGAETMAAILKDDPPELRLADVTPALARILSRCLEKAREARFQSARDLAFGLEFLSGEHPAATASAIAPRRPGWHRHHALPWGLVAVLALVLVSAALWYLNLVPALSPPEVFPQSLPDGQLLDGSGGAHTVALSPDGTKMAYAATPYRLYLRSMDNPDIRPIPGTESYLGVREPVFSHDGKWIAFYDSGDQMLKKMLVEGGAAVPLCKADTPLGMSWWNDRIVFGQGRNGIWQVPDSGGDKAPLVSVRPGEEAHGPQLLPDGQHVLYTLAKGTARDRWEQAQIVVQSVSSPSGEPKVVLPNGTDARYLSTTGHLVYARAGSLYAAPFDLKTLVAGGSVPMVDGIDHASGFATGAAQFSVSDNGKLVYVPAPVASWSSQMDIAFMTKKGDIQPLGLPPGQYVWPRIAPDDQHIVFGNDDGKEAAVWISNTTGTMEMRQLTSGSQNLFPIWSSDSQHVAFQSDRERDLAIWWQPTAGGGEAKRLTTAEPNTSHIPDSWHGDTLLFDVKKGSEVTLWTKSIRESAPKPFGDVRSSNPTGAQFSRDGHWVAYARTEKGQTTIYIESFPAKERYRLPPKGSDLPHHPRWSAEGNGFFYDPRPNGFEFVAITTQPFQFGSAEAVPKKVQLAPPTLRTPFDIASDGRIVGLIHAGQKEYVRGAGDRWVVVLNWFDELRTKVRR